MSVAGLVPLVVVAALVAVVVVSIVMRTRGRGRD